MTKKNDQNQITRKDALKKMGKYAALTAAGTFLILNPARAQVGSPPDPGGGFRQSSDVEDELFGG